VDEIIMPFKGWELFSISIFLRNKLFGMKELQTLWHDRIYEKWHMY
jgi:hypothetical protein